MALPDKDRQVGEALRERHVPAQRAGSERAASMRQHGADCFLDGGPRSQCLNPRRGGRVRVDPGRRFGQQGAGRCQCRVDRAEMRRRMRVVAAAQQIRDRIGEGDRAAVPARGDPAAALPETGPGGVLAGFSDLDSRSGIEENVPASGTAHADGVPAVGCHRYPRLADRDCGQALRALVVPGSEHRVTDDLRAGAPCLAAGQARSLSGTLELKARRRRLGCPGTPD